MNNKDLVQSYLDKATVVIGHNIAYDLVWLWESGFKYDGPVFDTMLADVMMQGQIFTIFIITIAAAEVGIGLAIVLMLFRNRQTANINEFDLMKW